MKRKRTVTCSTSSSTIKVTIEVTGHQLTRGETAWAVDNIASEVMKAINATNSMPLARMKVR
jgi:hypothetical protein